MPEKEGIFVNISEKAKIINSAVNLAGDNQKNEFTPGCLLKHSRAPDLFSGSGSIYDFLRDSDRLELSDAHNFAVSNGGDTTLVEEAAFHLAFSRRVEGLIANGVNYGVHVPNENVYIPGVGGGHNNIEAQGDSFEALRTKFSSGGMFKENPILNQSLFLDPIRNRLNRMVSSDT